MSLPTKYIGLSHIDLESVSEIANLKCKVALSEEEHFAKKISKGPELIKKLIEQGHVIYGVTTGLGENCGSLVEPDLIKEYPNHVIQFHGCALGTIFCSKETRAIIAARLISLAKGNSGVSMELLKSLVCLLQHDILPRIPQEGSVGASGDLSHLSYIGAVVCGYRTVEFRGKIMNATEALEMIGRKPLVLEYKEALAILNGTSAMTGVASLSWLRAQRISQLATRITSMAIVALKGNRFHYEEALFAVKNHPGQQLVAERIRSDLCTSTITNHNFQRIQDRYSLRCAPHVINHGLKGLQITMSGWTAEALKMCMPATVFSRSTESHTQDKVSMGTIAARDCRRVIELTEQVVAGMLIALRQALAIRVKQGEELNISASVESFLKEISKDVDEFTDDVFLEPILRDVIHRIDNMSHTIY